MSPNAWLPPRSSNPNAFANFGTSGGALAWFQPAPAEEQPARCRTCPQTPPAAQASHPQLHPEEEQRVQSGDVGICAHPSATAVTGCLGSMCDQREKSLVLLSPPSLTALASPRAHELGSHAARPEKGPRDHGKRRKGESWKISPGSGSTSREGGQQGASRPVLGWAVPSHTQSGHAKLHPRMPNQADPNCTMWSHAGRNHAVLSLGVPG